MTCREFERWLDDGMPEVGGIAALRAHAAGCASCAVAMAAATALDQALASAVTPAPAGFAARVMDQVRVATAAREVSTRIVFAPQLEPVLAWWVRAAAEPAAALALVLAALVLWKRDAIVPVAAALVARASGALAGVIGSRSTGIAWTIDAGPWATLLARPEVLLGFAFALAPAIVWASWRLWNWAEQRA